VLTAVLLVATMLGMPGDSDQANAARGPGATIGEIMIPAAAFSPNADSVAYWNFGDRLLTWSTGAGHTYHAPLWFPESEVTIRKITLIARDDTTGGQVCIRLFRAEPLTASSDNLRGLCTADNSDIPQTVSHKEANLGRFNTARHAPYLRLSVEPGTVFYAVQVRYTY